MKRSIWIGVPSVVIVLVFCAVTGVLLRERAVTKERIRLFRESHSIELVEGKTPDEVRRVLGPPQSILKDEGGRVEALYYAADGVWFGCFVRFSEGKAAAVDFDYK